ncbi:segregation/condensation protein A [archaeon]|nr:segregation/condensation protein A [archaeon]MBT4241982.1 segregation/condensation protein A [archaeon]MBT4418529.1 segregation/condensation protein A [archaeon]
MDFKEFLPDSISNSDELEGMTNADSKESVNKDLNDGISNSDEEGALESEDSKDLENAESMKIGQNQVYDVIVGRKPDWQSIIYDLIHTEQLDPWDIDIVVLTQKYFEKIYELEDEPDFYISSKVLFAAALLLRIKSEFLLNKYIKSIDEILFGRKDEEKLVVEKIEIDIDELPLLIPKTPLPRARRVTLPELMSALNKAINTESRRIKREVAITRARKLSEVDIPEIKRVDLKDRIKQFYARVLTGVKKKAETADKHLNKICYHDLIGKEKEEKLACFLPLLHLSNTKKLWLEQEEHLDDIWIYLYNYFDKNRDKFIEELEEDIEEMRDDILESEDSKDLKNADSDKSESVNEMNLSGLEKARLKREEKKRMTEEIKKELEAELGIVNKDEKLDEVTGFSEEKF